jgi:hypothetical protein
MKNTTKLILGGLLLSGLGVGSYLNCGNCESPIDKYTPREGSIFLNKTSAQHGIDLYEEMRKNINTGKMEASDFSNAWQAVQAANSSRSSILNLIDEGPDNVGGRTRAILVDNSDNNIVYAGSVSGGLFKSTNRGNTWSRVSAFTEVLSVSSMAQTANGTIYVGTGSTHESSIANGGSGGHRANGVYYTTDGGTTWSQLMPTPSWGTAAVNAIVADPNQQDVVYVGGNFPIRLYKVENKTTFTAEPGITGSVTDLKISKDGNVILAGLGSRTYVKEGNGSWTKVSGTGPGQVKESATGSAISRIEYAISHDKNANGKYSIYASMVKTNSSLGGISASHDNGATWAEVVPETANGVAANTVLTTDPFANGLQFQGNYNNIITTIPGDPKKFLIGGINVFRWTESATSAPFGQMSQVSSSQVGQTSSFYSHADHHEMVWDNANRLYIGNDGGIGISNNATSNNIQYYPANRGYNVTQFYGIGYSKFGDLIGGAQDNGTQYKDVNNPGTSPMEFRRVNGGDGFDCEISHLDPNVLFSSIYTGANYRTATKGNGSPFTGTEIDALSDNVKPFYNVTRLYETANDVHSTDSLDYYATENLPAGTTIMVPSKNLGVEFPYILPTAVTVVIDTTIDVVGDTTFSYAYRDTIRVQDKVQSMFALGLQSSGGVWVTRGALRFGTTPVWWKVMNSVSGRVTEMEFTKDGNILYVGTSGGEVYRVKGFNNVYYNNEANDAINGINDHDSTSFNYADVRSGVSQLEITTILNGSQYVGGLGVDPNNPEHLVVALGGYGSSTNIIRSTTAASTTGSSSFSSIRGNLPAMPVFDAVIDMSDPTRIIAGTEFGAWVSLNSGASWSAQNDEMGAVPVYDVRQQYRSWEECTNSGTIYFGTHGRGIWSSNDFLSIEENKKEEKAQLTSFNLYPNPATNFTNVELELTKAADVTISVFSLTGQMVANETLTNRQQGKLKYRVNTATLPKGIYFVTVQVDGLKYKGSKFIKE